MITMDMVGKIRRLHSRGNKSVREIAQMTGLARNTVAKWLKEPSSEEPKYRRASVPGKLAPCVEAVKATSPRTTAKRVRFRVMQC